MNISFLTVTLLAATLASASAQGPVRLVKNIATGPSYPRGSSPSLGVSTGALAFFVASQQATGPEVWRSDGTAAGTFLPAETIPGVGAEFPPRMLLAFAGRAWFMAHEEPGEDLIWTSDGTAAGTTPVAGLPLAYVSEAIQVGAFVFASGSDRTGAVGLWRTDFTPAGTTLVHTFATSPRYLTALGGQVLFFANDGTGTTGEELWVAVGTSASLLKDIRVGPRSSLEFTYNNWWVRNSVVAGTKMFFAADDGVAGVELWSSDGTSAGTTLARDVFPGVNSGIPVWGGQEFKAAAIGGSIVFAAEDASAGNEPWVSDGTGAGTQALRDIVPGFRGSGPERFVTVGGMVCFWADDGVIGRELWRTNGTVAGTALVKDITPGNNSLIGSAGMVVNGVLFFAGDDGSTGLELWRSDGSTAGTHLVHDLVPGGAGSQPHMVAQVGTSLLFTAADGVRGFELWRSDGSIAGTVLVADLEPDVPGSSPSMPVALGDTLLFIASDDGSWSNSELWRSDGSAGGTAMVKDINPFSSGVEPAYPPVAFPGFILFGADDGSAGRELWRSDGTAAGTVLVKDIHPNGSALQRYDEPGVSLGRVLLFAADDGVHGAEVWRSDGTATGTFLVSDINAAWSSGPYGFLALDGLGLFFADDGINGYELWRSDGTRNGTSLVKDIWPGLTGSDDELGMVSLGAFALLAVSDGTSGFELWRSDGTTTNTYLVKDIRPGPASSNPDLWGAVAIEGVAYFSADDGTSGVELWRSDGTAAGTWRVSDHRPGAGSSWPRHLTELAGALLFAANDGSTGMELCRSDGTTAGTRRLTDLRSGLASSIPSFSDYGGIVRALPGARRAFFTASDGRPGLQLWWTDGTNVGRHHAIDPGDLWPGAWPHLAGTTAYIPGWDSASGLELRAMRSMAAAVPFGSGCTGSAGWPKLRGTGPVLGTSCDLRVSSARPSTAAAIGLDVARAAVDLGGGCTLFLATIPLVLPVGIDATGRGSASVPVPTTPWLNGRQIFAQAAVLDPNGGSLGTFAWTNALQLVMATE